MLQQDLSLTDLERARLAAAARRARKLGMTLIEIMIVVVIMALVATGVGIAVLPSLQKAKVQQTETAVQTVKSAVTMYIATNNTECATMEQLIEDKAIDKSTATRDPWDHEFQIDCDGTDIKVKSAGPDGEFETADDIPKDKSQNK
ncbi:MAG: ral secretion pathway protein [Myxococcaceae bacterium]|nr:ral secretion pathway protein [Myxococcaceae bacterium]